MSHNKSEVKLANPLYGTYKTDCPKCNSLIYPLYANDLNAKQTCLKCGRSFIVGDHEIKMTITQDEEKKSENKY